eukprot:TRINITY_DN460_c0_g1_i17.p2 TRINITY_DN460_c0_g1~~TRINITY_DN460_c0_g1_i17.p2  ORF type:complete len:115 (+),score=21.11 TRINITY_DN460_c0_g1_i17:32-376(+)
MAELPGDVLKVVFGFLDVVSLLKSRRVCVLWREQSDTRFCEESIMFMNKYFKECHKADNLKWGGVRRAEQPVRPSGGSFMMKASVVRALKSGTSCLLAAIESGWPSRVVTTNQL